MKKLKLWKVNMKQLVENLNKGVLIKSFKRLQKSTKGFSSLIVRDPLDFLDFEVNLESNLDSLIFEINSGSYHPQRPYLHLSAKSKGINRPTVVLDVKDALVYRFCIEQIDDELINKTRQKNIRGGMKITPNRNSDGDDFYEKWFKDWMEYQEALQESLENKKFLVTTDIASYFENINILVLKDLIRGDVEGKKGVLNLLFYFLENTRFRYDYEVNTFNGLPQEDIDCSRILAYYFLNSHDQNMGEFCKKHDSDFYRFVDDMSIVVNTEADGKWALKCMAESLRKLNLVSSIEKTSIVKKEKAKEELFFDENYHLNELEENLKSKLKSNEDTKLVLKEIKKYYAKLIKTKKDSYKNWGKILKRFYSLCIYAKSDFFFDKLIDHLKEYPLLFTGDRIRKYLLQNQENNKFNDIIESLVDYLYSEENLYPSIESNILEILLFFNQKIYSEKVIEKIKKLSYDIFFQRTHQSLSDYARAISCLLVYKFDHNNLRKITNHYLKTNEQDNILKKYLIFVSLTINNQFLNQRVLEKARKEQNLSINRMVNFVDNINKYKDLKPVRDFILKNKVSIIFDKKRDLKIERQINPVRSDVLKKIIEIHK